MSSKKLSTLAEVEFYHAHEAYIRIFKYKPLNQFDHLLCIHGDRGQGTRGEVAHLTITAGAYAAIAERFPIAEREANLFRSEFFAVSEVLTVLQEEAEALATSPE